MLSATCVFSTIVFTISLSLLTSLGSFLNVTLNHLLIFSLRDLLTSFSLDNSANLFANSSISSGVNTSLNLTEFLPS